MNSHLTTEHAAVLRLIAAELDLPLDALYVGDAATGAAVFYEDPCAGEGTRCACAVGSPSWNALADLAALLSRV